MMRLPSIDAFSAEVSRRVRPYFARRMMRFKLERSIVSFSFDDFPRSAMNVGAAQLEAQGWRGTFYTSAGLAGISNHHGEHFHPSDLSSLQAAGHEIGGHSYSHVNLRTLGMRSAQEEIRRNKSALAVNCAANAVRHFAYPFGESSIGLKASLAGEYISLRGIRGGVHHGEADLNELKAQALDSDEHLAAAHSMIDSLATKPGWLILFTHDISETPSEWGCSPAQFANIISAVKTSGAQVLPVGVAIESLGGIYG